MAEEDVKAWYAIRVKTIKERVGAHDILRRHGVSFKSTGDREEQFSCPFHGKDDKPSARVWPATPQGPSHAWCYVCKERWDVIKLWQKYSGEEKSFHRILSELEKTYGIEPPPIPQGGFKQAPSQDERKKQEWDTLFEKCEARLIATREDYVRLGDMIGYVTAGSLLDKALFQVGLGTMTHLEGVELLNRLIQKIGEKVRGGSSS